MQPTWRRRSRRWNEEAESRPTSLDNEFGSSMLVPYCQHVTAPHSQQASRSSTTSTTTTCFCELCHPPTERQNATAAADIEMPPSSSTRLLMKDNPTRCMIPILIVFIGMAASTAFVTLGAGSGYRDHKLEFERTAAVYPSYIRERFHGYKMAGLWAHQALRHDDISREEFRHVYDRMHSTGLEFQSLDYVPRVDRVERASCEAESRQYYAAHYPDFDYQGFVGLETTPDGERATLNRTEQEFYFIQHYVEPFQGNEDTVDYDAYSCPSRRLAIAQALETNQAALSQRYGHSSGEMVMIHPGYKTHPQERMVLIKMHFTVSDFIHHATHSLMMLSTKPIDLYVFDITNSTASDRSFLGAMALGRGDCKTYSDCALPEVQLNEIPSHRYRYQETIDAMSREWTIVVTQKRSPHFDQQIHIVFGGVVIFVASVCLAIWCVDA